MLFYLSKPQKPSFIGSVISNFFLATYYNKLLCPNKILTNSLSSLRLFHSALSTLKFSLLLIPLLVVHGPIFNGAFVVQ